MDAAERRATGPGARVPARPSGPAPVGIAGRRSEESVTAYPATGSSQGCRVGYLRVVGAGEEAAAVS